MEKNNIFISTRAAHSGNNKRILDLKSRIYSRFIARRAALWARQRARSRRRFEFRTKIGIACKWPPLDSRVLVYIRMYANWLPTLSLSLGDSIFFARRLETFLSLSLLHFFGPFLPSLFLVLYSVYSRCCLSSLSINLFSGFAFSPALSRRAHALSALVYFDLSSFINQMDGSQKTVYIT